MPELTRLEFEAKLLEQGYKLQDRNNTHTYLFRKVGSFVLRALVHEHVQYYGSDKNWRWDVHCNYFFGNEEEVVIRDKRGDTYDIDEFNKAQKEIAKELEERVIPELIRCL